jgi:hypothetical protein
VFTFVPTTLRLKLTVTTPPEFASLCVIRVPFSLLTTLLEGACFNAQAGTLLIRTAGNVWPDALLMRTNRSTRMVISLTEFVKLNAD